MAPYLHMDDLSLLGKMVSVAYPVGDVILVGAVVRLALDAGRREPAFYLLTASIVLLLITDFAYGLLTLHGLYDHQLWLDAGWIGSYLLWGAAGLHPSMARLDQPVPGREVVLTRFRLALLTCASLMAPVIGIVHDLRDRRSRLHGRARRVDRALRPRRRADGRPRPPAGALARARAPAQRSGRRARRGHRARGDRPRRRAAPPPALARPAPPLRCAASTKGGALRVAAVAQAGSVDRRRGASTGTLAVAATDGEVVTRLDPARGRGRGPAAHAYAAAGRPARAAARRGRGAAGGRRRRTPRRPSAPPSVPSPPRSRSPSTAPC